jgi:hypothetical protein
MRKIRFKSGAALAALVMLLVIPRCGAAPGPAFFTYQGYLTVSNAPANGLYSFEVRLFDAETNGNLVAVPQQGPGSTAVVNGLFTLQVSLPVVPDGSFNIDPRWMELIVWEHPEDPSSSVTLSPRQRITPVPQAAFAFHAATADSVEYTNIAGIPIQTRIPDPTNAAAGSFLRFNGTSVVWVVWFPIATSNLMDGAVTLPKLSTSGAVGGQTLAFDGTNAGWKDPVVLIANGTLPPSRLITSNAVAGQLLTFDGGVAGWKDPVVRIAAGAITASNLAVGAVTTAVLADGAVTAAKVVEGNLVKGINGMHDDLTLAVNDGLTLTTVGSKFTIGAPLLAGIGDCNTYSNCYWTLRGNGGTTAGLNFLGTTDNQPLEIKVYNNRVWRAEIPPPFFNPDLGPNIIGGFRGNIVSSVYGGTVGGGGSASSPNGVTGIAGTIGGGVGNTVQGDFGTVGAGYSNQVTGASATIAGGSVNQATAEATTVGGGLNNAVTSRLSVVAGGANNTVGGEGSAVGGGAGNWNLGHYSTIAGGNANGISNAYYAAIGGGYANLVTGGYGTVAGGDINVAGGGASTVGGGVQNWARAEYSTVVGGQENIADGRAAFVGGGYVNRAWADFSVVAGGGGYPWGGNNAFGPWDAVVGGYANIASNLNSFIGGGANNLAFGNYSTISGGRDNETTGNDSVIGGGASNRVSGNYSTIAGGRNNTAVGLASFAAGTGAKALHPTTFVWNDTLDADFSSTASGQFLVHAKGGVGVNVSNPVQEGVSISSVGTALELRRGSIRVTGAGLGTTGPAFIHRAVKNVNITDNYTLVDHPLCNGDANAILMVTPNYNPGGAGGTYNNHPIGVFYVTGKWAIFNQDLVAMADQSAFNVLVIKP